MAHAVLIELNELARAAALSPAPQQRAAEAALHSCRDALKGIMVPPVLIAPVVIGTEPQRAADNAATLQQHLLFLVHGTGQNDDFKDDDQLVSWDGSAGSAGSSHSFRAQLEAVLDAGMRNAPLQLSVTRRRRPSLVLSLRPRSDGGTVCYR